MMAKLPKSRFRTSLWLLTMATILIAVTLIIALHETSLKSFLSLYQTTHVTAQVSIETRNLSNDQKVSDVTMIRNWKQALFNKLLSSKNDRTKDRKLVWLSFGGAQDVFKELFVPLVKQFTMLKKGSDVWTYLGTTMKWSDFLMDDRNVTKSSMETNGARLVCCEFEDYISAYYHDYLSYDSDMTLASHCRAKVYKTKGPAAEYVEKNNPLTKDVQLFSKLANAKNKLSLCFTYRYAPTSTSIRQEVNALNSNSVKPDLIMVQLEDESKNDVETTDNIHLIQKSSATQVDGNNDLRQQQNRHEDLILTHF
ncbi:hypothetical protein MP638_005572 [Amoeboaphelidium occidentale]|nr:hypothetical protein MP638_005572 [Amoeboaphelidium occidentale]